MHKLFRLLTKPARILAHRVRAHGLATTWKWAWGRGVSRLSGALVLDHSRITPDLYVGPQYGRLGKRQLERAGINGGVNLRIEFDDAAHGLALEHYCHLPTVDETPPSIAHLREGARFIADVVGAGGKVFIHCAGGVGRAPSMAAAYLITQGHTLDEALALIRQGRPYVDILPPQLARLQEFEAAHRNGAVDD